MSFALVCVIVALVLFLLASFNVPSSRINLVALGLAFLTLAQLLGGSVVIR